MPLRYVVLRHEGISEPHFDLMFEASPGSELKTWRASDWPLKAGMLLEHLGDHRREYLTYEGSLSGGRGRVHRVIAGTHHVIENASDRFAITSADGLELKLKLADGKSWRCTVNEM